ncbi:hypothetical protein SAMN05216327_1275 [Dyadobacter sp. SG02]|nr:hypothetical protein SAMN05216327_1275 [Dyadobacter sp. SG02]
MNDLTGGIENTMSISDDRPMFWRGIISFVTSDTSKYIFLEYNSFDAFFRNRPGYKFV